MHSSTTTTDHRAAEGGTTPRPALSRLGRASALGLGVFVAAVVVGGVLNPGYSHRSDAMSSLAAHDATAPGVMIVGFLGLTLALLSAGVVLVRTLSGKAGVAGAVLVILAGATSVVVSFARLDCSPLVSASCVAREKAGTVSGGHVVHNLASLVLFVALVVGLFLLAAGLRRTPGLGHLARPTRAAAVAALVLMVWFGSGAYGDEGGIVQRALVLVAVGWPVFLAGRVNRVSGRR
ncbi:DUF998 domain-containing protein [Nocardioides sp. URHA0020]|uniref:DUF998 domain-containing protein n=1 Tax=Nocardioides sp. URHA0020 TaxID=1380392 RepID=UPI0004901AEF|nr:DUF998 domain-containing protein [Nocardioides sp. URHA0020]